jgi:hypothetical protein
MSSRANKKVLDNKSIGKVVKLSREYPRTAQNAKLLKQYLDQHGRTQKKTGES